MCSMCLCVLKKIMCCLWQKKIHSVSAERTSTKQQECIKTKLLYSVSICFFDGTKVRGKPQKLC